MIGVKKVPEFTYDVVMQTLLGQRHGTMLMKVHGNKIDGFLNILGNRTPFQGELDNNGVCILSGCIKTLVRTIEYEATGSADEKEIDLTLHGQRDIFHLNGIAYRSVEGE